MAGYSGTPLWKKLGYKGGMIVHVEGAPASYDRDLQLPRDIAIERVTRLRSGISLVHFFSFSRSCLETRLPQLRQAIDPAGMIWISWPKKSSGVASDINEDVVRGLALPLGLVDIKVCAVDDTWSALKLVVRRELRSNNSP